MTPTRPLHVLIVDDEDSFRMSLEIALKMSNKHFVESCSSGEDAVEMMQKDEFDVLLLDYKMSGMSGLDVLQWMQEKKVDTPVIVLTGAGSEEVAVEAMKLGAYDYLSKTSVEIERLALTIKSVHERHQYRREMFQREMEKQRDQERQKELVALRMFQNTVNSIGQFVNNGLTGLSKNLQEHEQKLLQFVSGEGSEKLQKAFADLRNEFDVISSGIKSMLDLSTMVTERLEGIESAHKEKPNEVA